MFIECPITHETGLKSQSNTVLYNAAAGNLEHGGADQRCFRSHQRGLQRVEKMTETAV